MPANPNTLTAGIPAFWSKQLQIIHYKKDVFRDIASFSEEATLKVGNTVHRPYKNKLVVTNTGADGSFQRQAITETDETLTVAFDRNIAFFYKEIDKVQNAYNFAQEFATDNGIFLSNSIDAEVIYSGCTAAGTSVIDNSYFGGSAGDAIPLNASNVLQLFTSADMVLNANNVDMEGRFCVLTPQVRATLVQSNAARETIMGDEISVRGRMGEYMGFGLHLSNNTLWSAEFAIPTTPTANDTVTLGTFLGTTITFQFVSSIGSTAGNVLFTTATDAVTNLAAAINAPGTTSSTQVAQSQTVQNIMIMCVAVAGTGKVTVYWKGYPVVAPSQSMTAAGNIWTAARQMQYILFGRKGAIDCVVQMKPNTNIWHRDGYIGDDIVSQEAFGVKTFADGAAELVVAKVGTSTMSATPYQS